MYLRVRNSVDLSSYIHSECYQEQLNCSNCRYDKRRHLAQLLGFANSDAYLPTLCQRVFTYHVSACAILSGARPAVNPKQQARAHDGDSVLTIDHGNMRAAIGDSNVPRIDVGNVRTAIGEGCCCRRWCR